MMPRAVVAGHICLDIIPAFDRPTDLTPGRLYEVGPALLATGGPVSNTGVALHHLGVPTTLMARLGADGFGQAILDLLAARDPALTAGMRQVAGETTSYTVVLNIPGRDRCFLHCPGANHTFTHRDIVAEQLAGAALFHFGYPVLMGATYANDGAELQAIYRLVKAAGLATSLDLAMPDPSGPSGQANWAAILQATLPMVDIFLPSADELLYMIDRPKFGIGDALTGAQLSEIGERLLSMGVAVAGVKLGHRGLYIRTADAKRLAQLGPAAPPSDWANREMWFPVYRPRQMVGATGAGDTTIAGFLGALLRRLPLAEAGRIANMVGASCCEAADALGGLGTWDATLARLPGATLATLDPATPGWHCTPTGTWLGPADHAG